MDRERRTGHNIGALIIRIGFWGILYYNYHKEPQNNIGIYSGLVVVYLHLDKEGAPSGLLFVGSRYKGARLRLYGYCGKAFLRFQIPHLLHGTPPRPVNTKPYLEDHGT